MWSQPAFLQPLRASFLAISALSVALSPAMAAEILTTTPSVHVAAPGAMTDAQLIEKLQAEGYTDIWLTTERPTEFTPRPEISARLNPDDPVAQSTPALPGWNGTARKDGRTVDVYVDPVNVRAASHGRK
jgi:hypothetical protein